MTALRDCDACLRKARGVYQARWAAIARSTLRLLSIRQTCPAMNQPPPPPGFAALPHSVVLSQGRRLQTAAIGTFRSLAMLERIGVALRGS